MPLTKPKYAVQAQALLKLRELGHLPEKIHSPLDLEEFSQDPVEFFQVVLGVEGDYLTDQIKEILEAITTYDRLLIPSGNNLGKTFTVGGIVCWIMGSVAAEIDPSTGRPRGAKVILPGTDHDAIFNTIYTAVIKHVQRANSRGWNFPGDISLKSVHWHVRPGWNVEPMSPPKRAQGEVAHAASGRHHENLWIIVEEGAGVREDMWRAFEGMASGRGNRIISPLNPTEPVGPAWERSRLPGWVTLSLSALDHPNVKSRRDLIPGAISHETVERRIRAECEDLGPYPEILPNEDQGDFIYELYGEADNTSMGKRVYRPSPRFRAQILGQWAEGSSEGPLFTPQTWDRMVRGWENVPRPKSDPDRVGLDLARLGGDEIQASPSWGETGPSVLRAFRDVRRNADEVEIEEFQLKRRIYLGRMVRVPNGEGPEVAERIHHLFPQSPILLDESAVGASAYDHLRRVLKVQAQGLSFGSRAPSPESDEPYFDNLRAAMYWRFSRLVRYGLILLPPDPKLREEAMATSIIVSERATPNGKRDVVRIERKEQIQRKIGRSPDRLDAAVMSVWEVDSTRKAVILGGRHSGH